MSGRRAVRQVCKTVAVPVVLLLIAVVRWTQACPSLTHLLKTVTTEAGTNFTELLLRSGDLLFVTQLLVFLEVTKTSTEHYCSQVLLTKLKVPLILLWRAFQTYRYSISKPKCINQGSCLPIAQSKIITTIFFRKVLIPEAAFLPSKVR